MPLVSSPSGSQSRQPKSRRIASRRLGLITATRIGAGCISLPGMDGFFNHSAEQVDQQVDGPAG